MVFDLFLRALNDAEAVAKLKSAASHAVEGMPQAAADGFLDAVKGQAYQLRKQGRRATTVQLLGAAAKLARHCDAEWLAAQSNAEDY